jgi:hypothetical protein
MTKQSKHEGGESKEIVSLTLDGKRVRLRMVGIHHAEQHSLHGLVGGWVAGNVGSGVRLTEDVSLVLVGRGLV